MARFKVNVRDAVPLSDLAKKLPRRPHPVTLLRYCKRGAVSPVSNKTVHMHFVHLPRGIGSTPDAYYEFLEALNRK